MKTKSKWDGVTASFELPVETLAQVKKISKRVGMNASTFYRFATIAALRRYAEGADL